MFYGQKRAIILWCWCEVDGVSQVNRIMKKAINRPCILRTFINDEVVTPPEHDTVSFHWISESCFALSRDLMMSWLPDVLFSHDFIALKTQTRKILAIDHDPNLFRFNSGKQLVVLRNNVFLWNWASRTPGLIAAKCKFYHINQQLYAKLIFIPLFWK